MFMLVGISQYLEVKSADPSHNTPFSVYRATCSPFKETEINITVGKASPIEDDENSGVT
jgi:hypothetical protein